MTRDFPCPKCGRKMPRTFPDDCPPEIAGAISRITRCAACVEDLRRNNERQNRKRRLARATAPDP